MKIKTTKLYPDEWIAIDEDTYNGYGSSCGVGNTEAEAIVDLMDQLKEKEYRE